jgi:nucleotide-binding universal stress UspA family protein
MSSQSLSNPAGGQVGFEHVMVAVDPSDQACFALTVATRLAHDLHSHLSLVHVVHMPPVTTPDFAYSIEMRPICLETGQKFLDELTQKLPPGTIKVLREGDPAAEITDAAIRLGADLLIMGTHGRGRFATAVVGSVAHKVMQKVTCPVLCVANKPEPIEEGKTYSENASESADEVPSFLRI